MNANTTSDSDELIFGHFTPTVLLVVTFGTVVLGICSVIACYIDFVNMNRGIGKLAIIPESTEDPYPEILMSALTSIESVKGLPSKEETSGGSASVKIAELSAEAKDLPKVVGAPPVLGAHTRQARIIEAIYNASGRDVPPQYKSKEAAGEKIVIPERIQETLEGIADRDANGEGSPVASPSNFTRHLFLPPLKKRDYNHGDLTTTATHGPRPPKKQDTTGAAVKVTPDVIHSALMTAPGTTPTHTSSEANSTGGQHTAAIKRPQIEPKQGESQSQPLASAVPPTGVLQHRTSRSAADHKGKQ
ncbi:hypothetical protein RB195_016347 [Necator americanus]|uniref:Uncharacterized protein n=1 Tax=Necator americanus TaxID=51031 RepID=A0ABR1EBB1_NECAM